MVNIKLYLVIFGRGAMLALGFMSWKVPLWHYAWRVSLWHDLLWQSQAACGLRPDQGRDWEPA